MKKACLSCRRIFQGRGPRCTDCSKAYQKARDRLRGTPTQRGYGPEYQRNRALVLANGPHPCAWGCGRVATTADHVVPLSKGGSSDVENLVPACKQCNYSRGSTHDLSSWRPVPNRW